MTDPRVIQSFEEYLLAKGDLLRFGKDDVDGFSLTKLQHFIGFILGERDLQEQRREEQAMQQEYQQFRKRTR